MATWHVDVIEERLAQMGWRIISRIEPDLKRNEHNHHWIISRKNEISIFFLSDPDADLIYKNVIPPISLAYGCFHTTEQSLYFYKKGIMWDKALESF